MAHPSPSRTERRAFLRNSTALALGFFMSPYSLFAADKKQLKLVLVGTAPDGLLLSSFQRAGAKLSVVQHFPSSLEGFDAVVVNSSTQACIEKGIRLAAHSNKAVYLPAPLPPAEIAALAGINGKYPLTIWMHPLSAALASIGKPLPVVSEKVFCVNSSGRFPSSYYDAEGIALLGEALLHFANQKLVEVAVCTSRLEKEQSTHMIFNFKSGGKTTSLHWFNGHFTSEAQPIKKEITISPNTHTKMQGANAWAVTYDAATLFQDWMQDCFNHTNTLKGHQAVALMANVAELLLAGNVALVASQNLPGVHISKFISGQYLKFRWNSSTQSVVDRKDIEQFELWTLKRLLNAP